MNPAPNALYSYNWAKNVVAQLWEKHTRVHAITNELLGISDRTLANLLAKGRPEFAVLRKLVQTLDEWEIRNPGVLNTRLHRDAFLKMYSEKMPEKLLGYLTMQLRQPTLEEQGSRGGGKRSASDDSRLPLDFSEAGDGI